MSIIYCWTNTITNKRYIGQTIHPDQRKRSHIHEAFKCNSDYYFHRSLRKYGLEAFKYEVLEVVLDGNLGLDECENFYIEKYNTIWPNGYNQCLANSLDASAIKKMSDTKKRQWLELSDEDRLRWFEDRKSFTMKDKRQTDNQKKKAAEANQKEWVITHPDGKIETIVNLRKFCIDMGLGNTGQSNLTRGSYKGYKAARV